MKQNLMKLLGLIILLFGIQIKLGAQQISDSLKVKITNETNLVFEKSINASETMDVKGISESVDDRYLAGFIDNGMYFSSFENVMNRFKERTNGVNSQKIDVVEKRITVLSEDAVVLTTSGKYSAVLTDGRVLNGKFAWTFIYKKIGDTWKVIHSHMSNPK
jgi:hypothetical protein